MAAADALVGSELITVVQGGQNKTSTPFAIKTYIGVSGTNTGDETQATIKTKLGQAASGTINGIYCVWRQPLFLRRATWY